MAAYIIFENQITDLEKHAAYGKMGGPSISQYGGKMIVRDSNPEAVEGDRHPHRVVVIAFDSVEQAKRWYYSPEYQAARKLRLGAATYFNAVLVEGF